MTVRSLESVHQLRYSRLCNVLPRTIWAILGVCLYMIHVHLVMVAHRAYLSSRSLELMHDVYFLRARRSRPAQYIRVHLYCSAWLSRYYIVDLATLLYFKILYCQFVHVHVSIIIILTQSNYIVENPAP